MKRSISFFFLVLFSFSLTSYSIELHYCKGSITDVSFFGDANCTCENSKTPVEDEVTCKKSCHSHELSENDLLKTEKNNKCCKTEKLTLTSSKLKAFSSTEIKLFSVWVSFIDPISFVGHSDENDLVSFSCHAPLLTADISLLYNVFRI
ncbi:MAG: hypothetical protein IPM77_06290 [Crocinitomicaceae bacterium]|nr:hypothetical protein [Crocinitomicaceae bacterium]